MEETELSRSKAVQRMHKTMKDCKGSMRGAEDRLWEMVDEASRSSFGGGDRRRGYGGSRRSRTDSVAPVAVAAVTSPAAPAAPVAPAAPQRASSSAGQD
eukprot:4228782-Karenia_brevis.AAC.1